MGEQIGAIEALDSKMTYFIVVPSDGKGERSCRGFGVKVVVHVMRLGSEVKLAPEQEDETDLVELLNTEKTKYPYTVTENNLAFTNRLEVTARPPDMFQEF
ncbi:MAG: hypothetical protein IPL25_20320 [Saprospiraceae bacterium]|nr:hypothetical protein [Candidatus Vicinibacter affinis]